jgi:hypothetical protein
VLNSQISEIALARWIDILAGEARHDRK